MPAEEWLSDWKQNNNALMLERKNEPLTSPTKNAVIRLRHLQKRSLSRKTIIFALQIIH
jgi:hypothetical protein